MNEANSTPVRHRLSEPVRVGLVTVGVLTAVITTLLLAGALRPVDLLTPGRHGTTAEIVAEDFGPDAARYEWSYDGQEVYAIARGLPDFDQVESTVGLARYRMQRILAPAIASLAGPGTPIVLVLLALNLLGCGLAAGGLADLSRRHGRDPLLGYLAVFPLLLPLLISTSEPLAFGLAFVGVALADRGRLAAAVVVLALAGLGRETAAAVAVGAGAGLALAGRMQAGALLAAIPAAVVGAWYVLLGRLVEGHVPDLVELGGFRHADGREQALALATFGLSVAAAWWWRDVAVLWPVALGFGLWVGLYVPDTLDWLALVRVSAPSLILGVAGLAHEVRRHPSGRSSTGVARV